MQELARFMQHGGGEEEQQQPSSPDDSNLDDDDGASISVVSSYRDNGGRPLAGPSKASAPSGSISTTGSINANATRTVGGSKKSKGPRKNGATGSSHADGAGGGSSTGALDDPDKDDDKKKRSSKACDSCRKAKCKCTRVPNEDGAEDGPCQNCKANGLECTYLGASKKRGPPKGYIEAIENRMHRMEALLGGLLNNDDPRAQALLEDLVGDIEARELLSRDLQVAARTGRDNAPLLKSWQRPSALSPKLEEVDHSSSLASASKGKTPITQRGFDLSASTPSGSSASPFASLSGGAGATGTSTGPSWLSEEDLLGNSAPMEFERTGSAGQMRDPTGSGSAPGGQNGVALSTSPRNQRRKLPSSGQEGRDSAAAAEKRANNLFSGQQARALAPSTIPHTGTAYFSMSAAGTAPFAGTDGDSPATHLSSSHSGIDGEGVSPPVVQAAAQQEGPLSELADVVGQLSLDENREVRYHGRSSGLYLISKSARYQDFFWRFPKAGVWPPAEDEANFRKTEDEMVANTHANDVMPDKRTSDHLMELYWIYVHPHIPLLYRSLFVRQYRNTVHGAGGADGVTEAASAAGKLPAQAVGGKVPAVLLLAVYAVAARFSDTTEPRREGQYWKAGDSYAKKAKELVHEDFGSSRLTTVQALLLLAYREIGCGAMAQSWTYVGMAVRMAQDMGLFRDVDKWFLPVNAFGYEEKQTRKRVWWTAIVLDKYVSAYIGRPMAIFERDYDVALPAEDEPDEHDIWRPIRPDGTDWSVSPIMDTSNDPVLAPIRSYPQGIKSNSISCFNHSATLSVLFSRIIANLYAIRVRVLGQNSESLLAHLDQALANWYISLPPHLQYSSASRRVPPPHVLALHCQFFAALILLHRPFIPAHGQDKGKTAFPSHSICTTAAAAISNIVTLYSKTYTLRQCIPFLTYYIFSASIMHVYNSTYDESLAPTAKVHLVKCMRALQEMHITWASASRQCELLLGIVDLRDVDTESRSVSRELEEYNVRKRQAETQDVDSNPASGTNTPSANPSSFRRLTTFHTRPSFANGSVSTDRSQSQTRQPPKPRRSASMSARNRHNSISAAGLKNQNSTADVRMTSPAMGTSLPSTDFTFFSPSAHSAGLPATSTSPALSTSAGFNFSHSLSVGDTSPYFVQLSLPDASASFGASMSIPAADTQHSFNILGLSQNSYPYENHGVQPETAHLQQQQHAFATSNPAAAQDLLQTMGLASPTAESGYPNLSDFLLDPFWQNLQALQQGDHAETQFGDFHAGATQEPMGSEPQDNVGFHGLSQSAFLGVPLSADPSADDWASYLSQAMPRDSPQP